MPKSKQPLPQKYEDLKPQHKKAIDSFMNCMVQWRAWVIAGYGSEEPIDESSKEWRKWRAKAGVNASVFFRDHNIQKVIKERYDELAMSTRERVQRFSQQPTHIDFIDALGNVDLGALRDAGLMYLVKSTKWNKNALPENGTIIKCYVKRGTAGYAENPRAYNISLRRKKKRNASCAETCRGKRHQKQQQRTVLVLSGLQG